KQYCLLPPNTLLWLNSSSLKTSGYLLANQAGIVAVGVPNITLSPFFLAFSITLSKYEKSKLPSVLSIICHANSPILITLQLSSNILSRSLSIIFLSQCSG